MIVEPGTLPTLLQYLQLLRNLVNYTNYLIAVVWWTWQKNIPRISHGHTMTELEPPGR